MTKAAPAATATRVRRTKEERFLDKGTTAVKKVLLAYDELRTLASKGGYTDAQVEKIFSAIEAKQVETEKAFKSQVEEDAGFTLADTVTGETANTPA